jgi:hypothetical protein
MSPEQKRKFNTGVGSIFLGLGAIGWGLTAYYALVPNPPAAPMIAEAPKVDIASCRAALDSWGYQATQVKDTVLAFENLAPNPQLQLDKATMAVVVCKLPLKSFCMGEGCETPGLSFSLQGGTESKLAKPSSDVAIKKVPANQTKK